MPKKKSLNSAGKIVDLDNCEAVNISSHDNLVKSFSCLLVSLHLTFWFVPELIAER